MRYHLVTVSDTGHPVSEEWDGIAGMQSMIDFIKETGLVPGEYLVFEAGQELSRFQIKGMLGLLGKK